LTRSGSAIRARSTSHSVAVRDGCTNIPLAAAWAQEDEAIPQNRLHELLPWHWKTLQNSKPAEIAA
jgi:hypothetical protein